MCVDTQEKELGDGDENLLNEAEVHTFRSTAARANYFALTDHIWRL